MTTAETIYRVLGAPRTLRRRPHTLEALSEGVRHGLPYSTLEAAMANLDLAREEISRILDLPPRTLSRRKRSRGLSPGESDRLVRLARIAAQTIEALGDADRASSWLKRPNRALGGARPLDLLDTDLGTERVEQVLGRLEHGVYS
jgi:putative toxin-antitoxin system antitoxin component (TIGR02293 family)